ncbi:MAG: DUF1704 domain-containing protein [Myxococcota bacterium]|nr:DUF1704 domain-containing protein [Myxococcota bacterium]
MTVAALLDVVKTRLAESRPIRRSLAGGGRLHIDRPVPFLAVYRRHAEADADAGTADLVRTQAAYLIAPPDDAVAPFIEGIATALADVCGGCLLLEVFAGDDATGPFRIHTAQPDRFATTIDALATALRELTREVEVVQEPRAPLFADAAREGVLSIALEVPPSFRSEQGVFPTILRALTHELAHVFQRTFFEFTRVQTPARPEHFHMMGRRRLVQAVRESDRALAALDKEFDILLAVTPVNTEAAWQAFSESSYTCTPTFHYRMVEIDPEIGKRRLYELPIEKLEDPVLAQLLRDKRREIDRRLDMLDDRDTPRFRYASLQLYGGVEDSLLADAEDIVAHAQLPARTHRDPDRVYAPAFADRAREELAYYQLTSTVEIRDDVPSLIVTNGKLLVPARLDVAANRVEALIQHEIGTHAVTYANGAAQPLHVLASGLAQSESLQEGLAMFAEYAVGGLNLARLRIIAMRVIAVRRMIEDVPFPQVVQELVERCGLTARAAFGVAVRVFRGGGLTKDAIYLRGLRALLDHLGAGGAIDPLLVGKIGFGQIVLVEELLRREVLRAPLLRPRWLELGSSRLARARIGVTPIDLVEGTI